MRKLIALAAATAAAVSGLAVPAVGSAQGYGPPPGAYYRDDPCQQDRHAHARNGTIVGGILGAVVGSQVAGRGNHTGGAIIGGAIGATAGHHIGAHSIQCGAPPRGYRLRTGCRWVNDRYRGRNYSYQVCRAPDGYWRPVR
jgi:hypothetical protein